MRKPVLKSVGVFIHQSNNKVFSSQMSFLFRESYVMAPFPEVMQRVKSNTGLLKAPCCPSAWHCCLRGLNNVWTLSLQQLYLALAFLGLWRFDSQGLQSLFCGGSCNHGRDTVSFSSTQAYVIYKFSAEDSIPHCNVSSVQQRYRNSITLVQEHFSLHISMIYISA